MSSPRPLLSLILASMTACSVAVAQQGNQNPSKGSTITGVKVFADRAIVTRTASAQLRQGSNRIAFSGLPAWMDEDSIRLSIEAQSGVSITYVRVIPPYVPPAVENEIAQARRALRQTQTRYDNGRAEIDAMRTQTEYLRRMAVAKDESAQAKKDLEVILNQARKIQATIVQLEESLMPVETELEGRKRLLAELEQRAEARQRAVVVDIDSRSELSTTLTLDYAVPGVSWTPIHELRMTRSGNTVLLTSYARVSQLSGEDWSDVEASFSTSRPSQRPASPALERLAPGNGKGLAAAIGDRGNSFNKALAELETLRQKYEENPIDGSSSDLVQSWKAQQTMISESSALFDQLQADGVRASYKAQGRVSISSDGKTVRIPLAEIQPSSVQKVAGAPAFSLEAARLLDVRNVGSEPLLPGPVYVFEDASFLGISRIPFVGEGRNFTVFLEKADDVQLTRIIDRKQSSIKREPKLTTVKLTYTLKAENLSYKPLTLKLADRVPTAVRDIVKIGNISATSANAAKAAKPVGNLFGGVGKDGKPATGVKVSSGVIEWSPKVQPRASSSMRVSYIVTYPPAVLAEPPPAKPGEKREPHISSRVSEDVKQELRRLEKIFQR